MSNLSPTRILDRLGILRPSFRLYESVKSLSLSKDEPIASDGLPLPPAKLRMRVICTPESGTFLESGAVAADSVRDYLKESGLDMEQFGSILEFGCGCGRVLRQWKDLPGKVAGSDYAPEQAQWCQQNLPFADVRINGAEPPLDFGDGQFDFAYSLSVFIHIAPPQQQAWMDEIHRVLSPGGHFLLSTHGSGYLHEMTAEERAEFDRGEFVFRWPTAAGTNLSAGFHPESYVRQLARGFDVVAMTPAGARDTSEDLYLLRRQP